jgi:hypothetical protein
VNQSIVVCHIATPAGARFSVHPDEEGLRQSLIEYHNDTIADGESEHLDPDASLEETIDAIEESENLSWESITLAPGFLN